jgi:hypothetical protein
MLFGGPMVINNWTLYRMFQKMSGQVGHENQSIKNVWLSLSNNK